MRIVRHAGTRMRLLDLIAQGRCTRVHAEGGRELENAAQFATALAACPLRYVLSDELVRCATQLAYAEGDRLSSCLDLIRLPARSLWVEWADGPQREALKSIPSLHIGAGTGSRHAGALITAAPDCRSALLRTFWSSSDEQAYLSPVLTRLALDGAASPRAGDGRSWRGDAMLELHEEPAIDELLALLHFSFADRWAEYYQARCDTPELRTRVLHENLSGCAFDGPMLLAFFLLLGAQHLLPRREVILDRLNHQRRKAGRAPLLDHVEVSAPLHAARAPISPRGDEANVAPRRLHHVRGHLVRRGVAVFWRSPHLRGSARFGQIISRTVTLRFAPPAAVAATMTSLR
jgi:hypothetical protein